MANALATFQKMIHNILSDLIDNAVGVYIDNILIYLDTVEEYQYLGIEVLRYLD
jgi:hypothetical protein